MYKTYLTACILALPFMAAGASTLTVLLSEILALIEILTGIVASFALVVFFWGIAVFMFQSGNADDNSRGKRIMFWGILVFFVMTSLWGMIQYLQISTGISGDTTMPKQPRIDPASISL